MLASNSSGKQGSCLFPSQGKSSCLLGSRRQKEGLAEGQYSGLPYSFWDRRALVPCGQSRQKGHSCQGPAWGGASHRQTLAGSLGRSASASPWSTFLTSPPILPLCCGMLQPDLSGTSLFFDGYSQSKKTKTPSLLKSEKPGKSPCNRSLGAHRDPFWLDSLADSRLFGDRSLPKEAAHFIHSSVHPFTHSFIQQKLI